MPEYSDKDLIQMQNDAMKRVMEMQRRAKESYSAAQSPSGQSSAGQSIAGSIPVSQIPPVQKSSMPVFSSQGPAASEVFSQAKLYTPTQIQTSAQSQSPLQSPDLVKQLFLLLGTDDPILNAALAYLL